MEFKFLIFVFFAVVVWLFTRWRSSRPEFPPLATSPDDPLMVEALAKATGSLDEFKRLLKEPKQDALIKIRFVSSSNDVEHLWAEVLETFGENELGVRLITPPVTHSGHWTGCGNAPMRASRTGRCAIQMAVSTAASLKEPCLPSHDGMALNCRRNSWSKKRSTAYNAPAGVRPFVSIRQIHKYHQEK